MDDNNDENNELVKVFGANFCRLFGLEFVRSHLRVNITLDRMDRELVGQVNELIFVTNRNGNELSILSFHWWSHLSQMINSKFVVMDWSIPMITWQSISERFFRDIVPNLAQYNQTEEDKLPIDFMENISRVMDYIFDRKKFTNVDDLLEYQLNQSLQFKFDDLDRELLFWTKRHQKLPRCHSEIHNKNQTDLSNEVVDSNSNESILSSLSDHSEVSSISFTDQDSICTFDSMIDFDHIEQNESSLHINLDNDIQTSTGENNLPDNLEDQTTKLKRKTSFEHRQDFFEKVTKPLDFDEISKRRFFSCKKIKLQSPNHKVSDTSSNIILRSEYQKIYLAPKRKNGYLPEEDRSILEYITKTGRYDQLKGNQLWKDMADEVEVCPGRSWQSLKQRFRKTIEPNLRFYSEMFEINQKNLDYFGYNCCPVPPYDDDQDNYNYGKSKYSPKAYTLEEDQKIIKFVLQLDNSDSILGRSIWIRLSRKFHYVRTWQSLRERFTKRIVRNLHNYPGLIQPDHLERSMVLVQRCIPSLGEQHQIKQQLKLANASH